MTVRNQLESLSAIAGIRTVDRSVVIFGRSTIGRSSFTPASSAMSDGYQRGLGGEDIGDFRHWKDHDGHKESFERVLKRSTSAHE
jgi:hypothetical protein